MESEGALTERNKTMAHQRPDDDQSHPDNPALSGENCLADGLAWPLDSEESRCPCGARASAVPLCTKCRARAAWAQRRAHRNRPDPEHGPRRLRHSGARGVESRCPELDRPRQRPPRDR
jgi:hypothetical protein